MARVAKFLAYRPNFTYITKIGQPVYFIGMQAFVPESDEVTIAELRDEVAAGHPIIYIDEDNFWVDEAEATDPMYALRNQLREQLKLEIAAENAVAAATSAQTGETSSSQEPAKAIGSDKQTELAAKAASK